jgi:pilus assembly protein TadC
MDINTVLLFLILVALVGGGSAVTGVLKGVFYAGAIGVGLYVLFKMFVLTYRGLAWTSGQSLRGLAWFFDQTLIGRGITLILRKVLQGATWFFDQKWMAFAAMVLALAAWGWIASLFE